MLQLITIAGILLLSALSFWRKKLTAAGATCGALIALLSWFAFGFAGLALLGSFFLLAVLATALAHAKVNVEDAPPRDVYQVLANGGAGAVIAAYALWIPQTTPFALILFASSFSAATADTVSSEMGTRYGSKFFNILGFKTGQRGDNGVVSLEGTLFGCAGSALIALCFCLFEAQPISHLFIIFFAGTMGNLLDSLLGATLERRGLVGNNAVNACNTIFAALVACILFTALVN